MERVNPRSPGELVTITIDDRDLQARPGSTVLEVAEENGIRIPHLCYHEGVSPMGSCRLCSVEVQSGKRSKIVASCLYPVGEGLVVKTDSQRVRDLRKVLIELLLARCPDVRVVRDLADEYGVEGTDFETGDDDCILCGLCVRVCEEYVGASALGFINRGSKRVVGTPWHVDPDTCIGCGACTYVCPTGTMQMEARTTERWRRELSGDDRLCRYARMGLVSYKICPNDFRCRECEVDQRLFEEFGTHPLLAIAPGLRLRPRRVGIFDVVEDRFYSEEHIWTKLVDDRVRMGLDDFARKLVGPMDEVTIHAKPGAGLRRGAPVVTVKSEGHEATLRSPISADVLYVNREVLDDPSIVDLDCYDRGWLLVVQASDFYTQTRNLVSRNEAEAWFEEQEQKLSESLGAGGEEGLVADFARRIGNDVFARLGREFFSPGRMIGQGR